MTATREQAVENPEGVRRGAARGRRSAARVRPEIDGPVRRCLASGERLHQDRLLRFVVGPGDELVPDLAGKLPGRGLWIRPERALLERAATRGLFARAAKAPVRVPEDLAERVGRALRRRCLESLGLARRAGAALAGHDKVRAVLERGEAALLLQAADGSPAQRARLAALGRGHRPGLEVIETLTAGELGEALGRGSSVHVAVLPGGVAERLRLDCARAAAYDHPGKARPGTARDDGRGHGRDANE